MKPLYAARIKDLGPGDLRESGVHGLRARYTDPGGWPAPGNTPAAYTHLLDLERKLRCRECDARGKAVVSIKWAQKTGRE
jgi:hypothetical protein